MDFRSLRAKLESDYRAPDTALVRQWVDDAVWENFFRAIYGLSATEVREQIAADAQAFLSSQ